MSEKVSIASRLFKFVKNKYIIATIIFLVIIFFFNNNNIPFIFHLQQEVRDLHKEEKTLQDEISSDSIFFNQIKDNKEAIERFGREEYLLKKSNEDLFVITSTPDKD